MRRPKGRWYNPLSMVATVSGVSAISALACASLSFFGCPKFMTSSSLAEPWASLRDTG